MQFSGARLRSVASSACGVFQDREAPVRHPHQVRPANAHVDIPRHIQPAHLSAEMLAAVNQFTRHKPFGKNSPLVINVPQEHVQCRQPLRQSLFDLRPLAGRDDPWHQIVGENFFRPLFAPVNREGDSLVKKSQVRRLLPLAQFFRWQPQQRLVQRLIMLPRHIWSLKHFVIRRVKLVVCFRGGNAKLLR